MMWNLMQTPGFGLVRGLLLLALIIATITDLHRRKIPNWLTMPLALCAIIAHGLYGGLGAAFVSLCSFVAWFVLGYLYYSTVAGKQIGAGDIKLIMAIAACIGFMPAAYVTFLSLVLLLSWLFVRWIVQGTARTNFAALFAWAYTAATPNVERVHFRPVGMVDRTPHAPFLLLAALLCDYLHRHGVLF